MAGKQFSLHRRAGKIWYVEFKDPLTGKFSIVKSSGCKNKSEAENWAIEHIKDFVTIKEGKMLFSDFVKGFWTTESLWYLNRLAEGKSTPIELLPQYEKICEKRIYPFFKDMKLNEITKIVGREFKLSLIKKGLSGSTIIQSMYLLRLILTEAEEQGLIQAAPIIKGVKQNPKMKGILTKDEFIQLFNHEWRDKRSYVANLLAANCGLRLGEVASLTIPDIDWEKGLILVHKSYNYSFGKQMMTPKNGKNRIVPASKFVLEKVKELISECPYSPVGYIFYGNAPDVPVGQMTITRCFQEEMDKLGIKHRERNITFHSHRSYQTQC